MFITTTLTACNDADEAIPSEATKLNINIQTAKIETRGLIESEWLQEGSQIGVFLQDMQNYYDNYINICFTANGTLSNQYWVPTIPIILMEQKAEVYAYYPYDADKNDMYAIPIDCKKQVDYLFGKSINSVNVNNNEAKVVLQHALARISLHFERDSYRGPGKITFVQIGSLAFSTEALMDVTTGLLTDFSNNHVLGKTGTFFLPISTDFLAAPTGNTDVINIYLTMDGVMYEGTTTPIQLKQGYAYKYVVKMAGSEIKVDILEVETFVNEGDVNIEFTKK